MTESRAYFILNLLSGIGPVRVRQLIDTLGSAAAILDASPKTLAQVQGIGKKMAESIAAWPDIDWEDELARCERAKVTLVTPADDTYPDGLKTLHDPPLCIYVRGDAELLQAGAGRMIGVVGSRRIDRYGSDQAEALSLAAAHADWIVVSGLARGIDTIAHQTVVNAKAKTVAVLGGGLGALYPQENVGLARQIIETGGAIISEQPLMMRPDRRTFPMRNRIISALSRGVLVVQAGLKSGSLITAGQAAEQGKVVFAVPGPVTSPQSRGCHQLLRDGARLVESFDDVIDEFSFLPLFSSPPPTEENASTPPAPSLPPLSDVQTVIVEALESETLGIDQLATTTEIPMGQLLTELFALEMKRVVRQLPGKRFVLYVAAETSGSA